MQSVLEVLSSAPGLWAFALLIACGLGLPPWAEEIASNLDYVREKMHEFQTPLIVIGIIGLGMAIFFIGRSRRSKLKNLLHLRKQRSENDAQR